MDFTAREYVRCSCSHAICPIVMQTWSHACQEDAEMMSQVLEGVDNWVLHMLSNICEPLFGLQVKLCNPCAPAGPERL